MRCHAVKLVMCALWACILGVMLFCNATDTYADSLRLPDAQREEVSKPVIDERGGTVVAPDIVEKKDVIVISPDSILIPTPEGGKKADSEILENPNIEDNNHTVPDINVMQDSAPMPSTDELPLPNDKRNVPGETIINIKEDPIVPSTTQRPAMTIEDILADPMKNKDNASPKADSLSLPKDTRKLDFLEGKWRCETDLINLENNTPVIIDFTFDKNGKGNAKLKEKTGRVFSGSANAVLKNGVLDIKVARLVTPDSSASYNGSEIQCKQKGLSALCSGKNTGTPPVIWNNATFHRVK